MKLYRACATCGNFGLIYDNSLCHDCYSEQWDAAFESSTDWSAKVAHSDLMVDLRKNITDPMKALVIINRIRYSFMDSDWYCSDCSNVFIPKQFQNEFTDESIYKSISAPCDKCKALHKIEHDYTGEK